MEHQTQDRRSFFRRSGVLALFGGLAAAGIGAGAYARGRWSGGEPLSEAQIDRMLKHFYVEIDATEEQKRRLAPIVKEAVRDLQPLHARLRQGRAQAIELLTAERVDPAAMEALRAEKMQLADEASRRIARAVGEAGEILTQAQRKELAARFARHRHRWHG